jgi:hypothetical protein
VNAEFDRAPRRVWSGRTFGGWRGLARPSRVAPRRRRLRALSAQRLRFADTRVIHSFHRDVGSAFWTPSNSPNGRPRLSPSLRASLCLRTCAPTAPASSRSYGRRSRGAPTCRPGVRGGCRAVLSDHLAGVIVSAFFGRGTKPPPAAYGAGAPPAFPRRGAPSKPQWNGRRAPAPPRSPRRGTFLRLGATVAATLVPGSRAEISGRGVRLWSLGSA